MACAYQKLLQKKKKTEEALFHLYQNVRMYVYEMNNNGIGSSSSSSSGSSNCRVVAQ